MIPTILDLLAQILMKLERVSEAELFTREAVAMNQRLLGGDHHQKATALSTLALYLDRTGQTDEAKSTITEASDMILRLRPPEHKLSKIILDRRKEIFRE